MRRSTILTLGCFLGLCFLLGQLLARPTSGQAEVAAPRTPGRFQMSASIANVIVIDTSTGQCWMKSGLDEKNWTDLGSPAAQK
jgi:hypothetical protein